MDNTKAILDEYRAADQVRRSTLWMGYIGLRVQFSAIERGTEDEIVFGKNTWVYCRQHCKPHQTGWCSVSPHDKVGLGVDNAQAADVKCREWGFELYADQVNP